MGARRTTRTAFCCSSLADSEEAAIKTSNVIIAVPATGELTAPAGDARRRLKLHYYAAMLSAAVVAAVLGSAAAYTGGQFDSLPHLLVQIAVWLVLVNIVGAFTIFRPVDRFLRGETSAGPALERRIRALPRLSGLWFFGLAAAAH